MRSCGIVQASGQLRPESGEAWRARVEMDELTTVYRAPFVILLLVALTGRDGLRLVVWSGPGEVVP